MLKVKSPKDLLNYKNFDLGVGKWILVDQKMINKFADFSGDQQWIHVDVQRASKEMPNGQTIAHGLLTLCLSPTLGKNQLEIKNLKLSINYGIDKVRFTTPVRVNSKVRMNSVITEIIEKDSGIILLKIKRLIEIEGQTKPAMVAETLSLLYPKD
jgi:acyl dehydratase